MANDEMGMRVVVDRSAAASGRKCGICSMCCKLLPIHQLELEKPPGEWCRHCIPGRGCGIYEDRPDVCRGFKCHWLRDGLWGDEWKPNKCKMVLMDGEMTNGQPALRVYVDWGFPGIWRRAPYYQQLINFSITHYPVGVAERTRRFLIYKGVELAEKQGQWGEENGVTEWRIDGQFD